MVFFLVHGRIKRGYEMAEANYEFSSLEQHLLNNFQKDMPLTATPYADMAEQSGVSEELVIQTIRSLQERGIISRVGPVFRANRIGVSTLAAMSVPEKDLECVARIISAFPEVNHNYEREHTFNLWFVVTAGGEEQLAIVLHEIELHTGYTLMSLPMLDDYFVDLGFNLNWTRGV